MDAVLLLVLLIAAHVGLLFVVARKPKSERRFVDLFGPLLLFKTERGRSILDVLARPRRAWRIWSAVGIAATGISAVFLVFLLLYQGYLFGTTPRTVAESSPPPEYLIGLPGINPLIPVGFGILGLLVALVVHEGAHGVLSRVHGIPVKSMGIVHLFVPIGAFVEPDEQKLEGARLWDRLRVFAAGPASNLTVSFLALALLTTVVFPSLEVVHSTEGMAVLEVTPEGPADSAGIRPGDIVVSLNGRPTRTLEEFVAAMNSTQAGERVVVEVFREGRNIPLSVVLADRFESIRREAPDLALPEDRGKGYLGVRFFELPLAGRVLHLLQNPFVDGVQSFDPRGGSFLFFVSYPFFALVTGFDILNEPYVSFLKIGGPLSGWSPSDVLLGANALYWIFWLNFMLGTFNSLPAGFLDGGQMFRSVVRSGVWRGLGVDASHVTIQRSEGAGITFHSPDPEIQRRIERASRITRAITRWVGVSILGLILLPIFGPPLLRALL